MLKKMMRFSVIVPMYNSEKSIDRCVKSVISQTYTNWELLLIDDGSVDSTYLKCHAYLKDDTRIRLFHQENCGASAARNVGLRNMQGDYVVLLDADDTLPPYALSTIVDAIKKYNFPDLIEFQLTYIGPTGFSNVQGVHCREQLVDKTYIEHLVSVLAGYEEDKDLYFGVFNVLRCVKTRILRENNLRFDEDIRRWEDLLFAISVYTHCDNAVMLPVSLYNYYGKVGGGLGGKYRQGTYNYLISAYKQLDSILRNKCNPFNDYAVVIKLGQIERCIKEIEHFEEKSSKKEEIVKVISDPYFVNLLMTANTIKGLAVLKKFHSGAMRYFAIRVYLSIEHLKDFLRSVKGKIIKSK